MNPGTRTLELQDVCDDDLKMKPRFAPRDGSDWLPHGEYHVFREGGKPYIDLTYESGVVHGPYCDYWSSGKVASEGQYHNGNQHGTWHFYKEDGSLLDVIEFENGREVRRNSWPW